MVIKIAIIWRMDLKEIPLGKKMTQSAHCSHIFLHKRIMENALTGNIVLNGKELEWFLTNHRTIVLGVRSEEDLFVIKEKAIELGIDANLVTDIGLTVFDKPTTTCLTLGPDEDCLIDKVTGTKGPLGRLKLV